MYFERDIRCTAYLAVIVGGMLLASVWDVWQQLLFALSSRFVYDLLAPFVVAGYVAHASYSHWLDPQNSDVGSRAPPTLSIV